MNKEQTLELAIRSKYMTEKIQEIIGDEHVIVKQNCLSVPLILNTMSIIQKQDFINVMDKAWDLVEKQVLSITQLTKKDI